MVLSIGPLQFFSFEKIPFLPSVECIFLAKIQAVIVILSVFVVNIDQHSICGFDINFPNTIIWYLNEAIH